MSESVVFVHGPAFQRSVLRLMMEDHRFCSKSVVYLKEDYFSGELKWFFRKTKEFFEENKSAPTDLVFQNEVLKHGKDSAKYDAERLEILKADVSRAAYLQSELTEFIRANLFVGSYREAASLYNGGDKKSAYEFTSGRVKELLNIDFTKERVTTFGDHLELLKVATRQRQEAVPTGILAIDEAMLGGLHPQSFTTFIGGSNVGKSMLCPNLAYAAMKRGKNTYVTIHEDEEIPTKLRYLARFAHISYNKLTQPYDMWTEEERHNVAEADKTLKKYVKLRFMYGSECFIENVADSVRTLKMDWDFHLWLSDYGQCLKSRAYKAMDDKYGLQEYVYSEQKQICLEHNIAGAGGAQSNRTGHRINKSGADFLRLTDIGDSWGICKKSSNVITMNRSDEDVKNNRIVFLLDKVRNGRCPVAVQCVTHYDMCITHIPTEQSQLEIPVSQGPAAERDDAR